MVKYLSSNQFHVFSASPFLDLRCAGRILVVYFERFTVLCSLHWDYKVPEHILSLVQCHCIPLKNKRKVYAQFVHLSLNEK